MVIGVSWENDKGNDIIGENYGHIRLIQKNIIEDEAEEDNRDRDIHHNEKQKCSDDLFPLSNHSSKVNIWCFKNPELLKILRHGRSQEIQTHFQIFLYRRGI